MRQTDTWTAHALVVGLVPFVAGGLVKVFIAPDLAMLTAAGFGAILGGYYTFIREPRDKQSHKDRGAWHTPDADGVTPLVDKHGDTLGPATAGIVWVLAWLLTL